jgi:FixJ family two-component response regulator
MPVVVVVPAHAMTIFQSAKSGADDFVCQPIDPEQLVASVRKACHRDATGVDSPISLRRRLASLTSREREVIEEFLQGRCTKRIATDLGISHQTVDKHRNRCLKKMLVGSVLELSNLLHATASGWRMRNGLAT